MALNPNFVFSYPHTDADIEDLFLKAMMSEGLIFDAKDLPLRMDGKTHYVKVSGRSTKNRNSRSGWYNGRLGDFPGGKFGWMHGKKPEFSWSLYRHIKENEGGIKFTTLSPEEAEQREIRRAQEHKQREQEEQRRHAFSKALSIIEWERSLPLKQHPYLAQKKLTIQECQPYVRIYNQKPYTPDECKQILDQHFPEYNKASNLRRLMDYQVEHINYRGFNLILRGQTFDQTPLMFQLIFNKKNRAGKNKHFPKDLIKQNTFLQLGPPLHPKTKRVFICEGWATGMSLLRFTQGGDTILVAWDSGNMQSVAITIRKHLQECLIYSASDNDHTSPDEDNAGLCAAYRLCRAVGAFILMPSFDSQDPNQQGLSDWNDIDLMLPPPESSAMFFNNLAQAPFMNACFDEGLQLLGENESIDRRAALKLDHSLEFKHFWISISLLVFQGLQRCHYSTAEQLEQLEQQHPRTLELLERSGLKEAQQHYDPSIHQQIAELFFHLNNEIHVGSKNLLAQSKLFGDILKQIRTLQKIATDANLLVMLHECLSEKLGDELALACIAMHLDQNHYFNRSLQDWHLSLCQKLAVCDLPPALVIALVLCSNEFDYWRVAHKFEREQHAVEDILNMAAQPELQQLNVCPEQVERQQNKLAHIFKAYHHSLFDPEQQNYLLRLISRYNQTEEKTLEI